MVGVGDGFVDGGLVEFGHGFFGEVAAFGGAILEWIEAWYNPHRRHSYCDYLSPIDYETANAA